MPTCRAAQNGEQRGSRIREGPAINDLAVLDHESIAHRESEGLLADRARALGFDEHGVIEDGGPQSLRSEIWEEGEQTPEHALNVGSSVCIGEHRLDKGDRRV